MKGKKIPESSKALETRVTALEAKTKTENSSNKSLFTDEKLKINTSP